MYFPLFEGVLRLPLFCYALLCVHFSFASILKRKRKLDALYLLSCRCIVTIKFMWHVRIQMGGGGQGVPIPLKNHKNIGCSGKTGPDPLNNRSYQASFQCWAIIGTPAKRHLMAFRWQAYDGSLIVLQKKKKKRKNVKVGPPLTKLSGPAHVWPFLTVPWVGLQCFIVVFPDHTYLLF